MPLRHERDKLQPNSGDSQLVKAQLRAKNEKMHEFPEPSVFIPDTSLKGNQQCNGSKSKFTL